MTGVRAGSQGTGVQAGSQGSGVGAGSEPATALGEAIQALSPALHLPLDDASGTFLDASGNGRNGTNVGGVTYQGYAGPDGRSYAVFTGGAGQGTGDYVEVADNAAFSPVTAPGLSFFYIARPTTVSIGLCVANKGLNPGYANFEWHLDMNSTGQMQTSIYRPPTPAVVKVVTGSAGDFTVNTTRAYCQTMSNNANTAVINQYINNNTIKTITSTTPGTGSVPDLAGTVQIGTRTDQSDRGYVGCLAHFVIFPGVLSAGNIASLMSAAATDGWI